MKLRHALNLSPLLKRRMWVTWEEPLDFGITFSQTIISSASTPLPIHTFTSDSYMQQLKTRSQLFTEKQILLLPLIVINFFCFDFCKTASLPCRLFDISLLWFTLENFQQSMHLLDYWQFDNNNLNCREFSRIDFWQYTEQLMRNWLHRLTGLLWRN